MSNEDNRKRSVPYRGGLTPAQAATAMQAARLNALDLMDTAEILFDVKRFAHSMAFSILATEEASVPIRLTQTPTTCRVPPSAGIKLGVGRCLNPARDAEQRAEGVERVEAPVEAERELIEVGL